MTLPTAADGRLVIPEQAPDWAPWSSLLPLRDALLEAGNVLAQPAQADTDDGFYFRPDGGLCDLAGPITAADWAMLQSRFVIPPRIGMPFENLIRDSYNWVDVRGAVRIGGR